MKKDLTTREGLLIEAEKAYKRASTKDKLGNLFAFLGIFAIGLTVTSGIATGGVATAEAKLLDDFSQTPAYYSQLKEDAEVALTSENIADSLKELNSSEYKEKVLYENGDEALIRKYQRLKTAEKALLITLGVAAGQLVLAVPEMKLAEHSQENDECRARDYSLRAYLMPCKKDDENENNEDDENHTKDEE